MTKILYIAGYGRSGSTVLNIILGNHSSITSVGELSFLPEDWTNHHRVCSCGAPYHTCEFWKDLYLDQPPNPELIQLLRKMEKLSFVPRILLGLVKHKDSQAYRAYQEKLFDYAASRAKSAVVVDSSKSARDTVGRFLALRRLARQDVYVLHLGRNGLATMESLLVTGSNWAIEGHVQTSKWAGLRAAFGWVGANVWTALLGRMLGPRRYLVLRYEDFLADPSEALRALSRLCGFEAEELIERINRDEWFSTGHLIGGNRVRFQGKIRLEKHSQRRYGDRLKPWHRFLFAIAGGGLNRYYGYE